MQIEIALNELDEMFDKSWSVPLSGGRCVIDVERARSIIDDIRANLPREFKEAENVVKDRDAIIAQGNKAAEELIKKAEERARVMLAQDETVKIAQQKANQILTQAQNQSKEMRFATHKFTDNVLRQSEAALVRSMDELKATRNALKGASREPQPATTVDNTNIEE